MHEPYVLLSITSDVRPKVLILLRRKSLSISSFGGSIGVFSVYAVTYGNEAIIVINIPCTEVHEAWRVEISAVSHPVLLVPLFGLDEGVSVGRLVNSSSVGLLVNQSKLGEGSLVTGGHHWRLSQVLKSHVWEQIRNDILTICGSHEHVFVVHTCVSKHHVPMVLGVEVSELN